jgi:UDP-2,3-diacylglucosamine hydrolase
VSARSRAELPELELAPGTLLVGDLHLNVSRSGGTHGDFARWTQSLAGVPRLIVLGDLFDAWVGPAHLGVESARAVVASLRALTARGVALDVIPGNRDFLLDERFEAESGARLRPLGLVGLLGGGRRLLCVHGDELCTRDLGYQRLKRVVRSRAFSAWARGLPRPVAHWIAGSMRAASRRALVRKPPLDKQQQPEAVEELARRHDCAGLVCGHAHVFREEILGPGGTRWWVLDAWGGTRDLLRVRPEGAPGPWLEALSSGLAGGAGSP